MTISMLDKIQDRLWQDKQPVTARWICYEYICQMAGAQEVLKECKDANKGKVAVTWLIEGIAAESGNRAVRVVPDSLAQDVKRGFSEVLSEQIYSITPSTESPDAASLIAGDVEQARKMMSGLLAQKNDNRVEAFIQNGCSVVKGARCVRKVIERKSKPAAAPASGKSSKPPLPKPKAASAPAAATVEKAGKKEAVKQEPSVKAEVGAKGKAKVKNPLANSFNKSAGKKKPGNASASSSAGAAKTAVEAPQDEPMAGPDSAQESTPAQNSNDKKTGSQQVLDDEEDDEEDNISPLPTKKPAAKARQKLVLEDSDDDDFAPAANQEKKESKPVAQPLKVASKPQASTASKKSASVTAAGEPAGADSDMKDVDAIKLEPGSSLDAKASDSGKAAEPGAEDVAGIHPEYGAPPHPDAEIAFLGSKAVWQYINDKGEEITVEAHKLGAAKKAAVKQQVPSKRAKPEPQEDGTEVSEEPKAAKKKKPTSKHQKAAVQASDIRNLFGKKK